MSLKKVSGMGELAEKIEIQSLPLEVIRRDGGTQMREAISEVTVITYAEHMQDGAQFPPIVVFNDGSDYWLADGFHRAGGYERAGIENVPAEVIEGTRLDAVKYALHANATNGKPRTSGDLKKAYDAAVNNGICKAADTKEVIKLLNCSTGRAKELTKTAREQEKEQRNAEIFRLHEEGKTQREIAEIVGVTHPTIGNVLDGKKGQSGLSYQSENDAVEIAANDPLAEAEQGENAEVAKKVKQENKQKKQKKVDQRRKELENQAEEIREGNMQAPDGLFDVIAIDPPWNYGREYDPESSRVANPYPEMAQDELLEIELPAKDDSVLFLWTTHQFIFDAKELMDKWGFTYKATIVWNKDKIGMGSWFRMQCEFCLVGIRGKPFFENSTYRDIITEPRREHSRKPDVFFEMVTDITAGRRLEYFSREKREGWEVFGNDIEKF